MLKLDINSGHILQTAQQRLFFSQTARESQSDTRAPPTDINSYYWKHPHAIFNRLLWQLCTLVEKSQHIVDKTFKTIEDATNSTGV